MFEHGDNKHGYGTCMSVEGDISPNALCHYFERKREHGVHYERVMGVAEPESFRLPHHAVRALGKGDPCTAGRAATEAGLTGMAWTATQGLAAASNTRIRFVFHVSSIWGGLLNWLVDRGYTPITAELEKRGFPSMLVHSSVRGSDTPNEDRASAVVTALQNVTDDVVIVGISNQGNFLPLVAAARHGPSGGSSMSTRSFHVLGRRSSKSPKRSRSPSREAISTSSSRRPKASRMIF